MADRWFVLRVLMLIIVVAYTDEEKALFRTNADACHKHRREVEDAMNEYMTESGFTYGTPRQQAIQALFDEHMRKKLEGRADVLDTLLPTYPPGCRRRESHLGHICGIS